MSDIKSNDDFNKAAAEAWSEVFPESHSSYVVVMGKAFFRGYLAKDKSEVTNGIWQNDPLGYSAVFNAYLGGYKEYQVSLYVKPPEGSYLAYDTVRLRLCTIKDVSKEKLVQRFKKVKAFLLVNKDNTKDLLFDMNKKLGV